MSEEENIEEPTDKNLLPTENENISGKNTHPPILSTQHKEENMEVQHSHHPTHKKKWAEYLLEFFMLFLAVFLGFIAENIRETSVEHHRENDFIRSLVNDIKADTVRIKYIIDQRIVRERRLDSLTFLLNSDSSASHTNIIYFYAVTPARSLVFRFIPNDGTIQQLKNSGAFRLIRNRKVADSIARYDVSVRNFLRQGEIEETLIQDYRAASSLIFDALVFDRILDKDNNVQMPTENPALLPYVKRDIHAWNYKMYSMKALNKANRRDAKLLLQQAENLLETLQKEYHLK